MTIQDVISKKTSIILIIWFSIIGCGFAQEKDSSDIYQKIKNRAYKKSFTTWLYHSVFVEPEAKDYPNEPTIQNKNVNPYLKEKDRIIRNIIISVYNPFGHKIDDTILHFNNFIENIANHVHINTRHWIIINRLLFKTNDSLNPLALSETERLLRQANFINDTKIYTTKILNTDSVDVNVNIYDKWPITIPSYVTTQQAHVTFRNQNLFGIGQQYEQYASFETPNKFDFNGSYTISNLDNTYISSQLYYTTNINGTSVSLSFDRPYYSPLAKWAGGASIKHNWGFYNIIDTLKKNNQKINLNSLEFDAWFGKNFKLRKSKTIFNQSTNIIFGERYYTNSFLNRPSFTIDTLKSNFNTNNFVGNIGFSIQKFYKDKFIYRFGSNEDVPEGLILQVIYGLSKKEFSKANYFLGAEIAKAKKIKFGYLTSTLSYGVFFNNQITNDITTKFKLFYLANLIKKQRWYFREFLTYNLVYGEHKMSGETLTLNSDEMYGLNTSNTITGNIKMTLNFETVAYAPYNLIGFKFAPVLMSGLGMLNNSTNKIENKSFFQAYSLGLLIRNENLVSSTFKISVGFYPFQNDGHASDFLLNPVTSFTLRVRNFSMTKPEFISY